MLRLLVATGVLAALAGCGGGDDGDRAAKAPEPVRLAIDAPADTEVVRESSVEVRGRVQPRDAAVMVMGEPAAGSDGEFSASVRLLPGSNVIDVMATAPGREPAMTAVRVTYEMPVPVPDLEGLTVEEAQDELDGTGLELHVEYGDGFLEDLLPGDPGVCEQDPPADTEVPAGTVVEVLAQKSC